MNSDFFVFCYSFIVEEFGNLLPMVSRKLDEEGGVLFVDFDGSVAVEFLGYANLPS